MNTPATRRSMESTRVQRAPHTSEAGMESRETLAVVVPAYNEGEGLREFHALALPVMARGP